MINAWPKNTYVLVPSYNSAAQLRCFLEELSESVPMGNICVADDGSGDGTHEFCVEFGVTCLRHNVNKGKGAALKTGFVYLTKTLSSAAKWIITMDADGQHSPADLPRFLEEAVKYPTIGLCIGARDMRPGVMPLARILSNRLTSAILTILSGQRIQDSQCGYRMYSRELITSVNIEYARFQMESEIILKAAAKKISIHFVPVRTLYLKNGASHISHLADTLRWAWAVLRVWYGVKFKAAANGINRLETE